MMPPLVKICGITNPADAALAASLGADFIGLIFCPSPRSVSVEVASLIRDQVSTPTKIVGVFKDQPVEVVNEIARTCRLDLVQLHGSENPDYIRQLKLPSIKVFTYEANPSGGVVIRNGSVELESFAPYTEASYILFDKPKGSVPSSCTLTQTSVLERLGKELATHRASLPPIIIAGSLTDSIVEDAVQLLNPFAVDVASGVEQSPGVKSKELMIRFISKVKQPAITGVRP